jgi:hypothetical protein
MKKKKCLVQVLVGLINLEKRVHLHNIKIISEAASANKDTAFV